MPSAAANASTAPSGATPLRCPMIVPASISLRRGALDDGVPRGFARQLRQLLLIDLPLQLDDAVDERFGPGRTARHEHVDRDDLIHALYERVVVEHAADRRTRAHR